MKEVFFMKKWIACILIVAMSCSLFGCLAKMTPVENFLLATMKMDVAAMQAEITPDEKTGSFYKKLQTSSQMNEDALQVLKALYSRVEYRMGETVSVSENERKVAVTLKVPDMERILSLAKAQILVSGDSASETLNRMISEGSISDSIIKEYSLSVKITKTDGVWTIPYGDKDNADFVKALALAEMIDFVN